MTGQARQRNHGGRVTLVDIAEHAKVSRATASLVLRDSPLVAEETRQRVLIAMQERGYVYNRAAASLRTQRSHTVGLVVTDITNPFYAELTLGVEEQLDAANHVVMLANTAESLDKQDHVLAVLSENNADGVLFCPAEGTSRRVIDGLRDRRLSVVLLVRYLVNVDIDYVGADNALGAALAVEHLITHGHRRIAFIGGPALSSARRDRLRGYRDALGRHGLPVDEALLPTSPSTRDGGHAAIIGLLALADPPTAALCYNDVVAFGVMLGLQAAGRVVGRDVAVVGFDDIAEAALWRPALTTVSIEPRSLGAEAARLLLQRIAHPDEPPRRIIISPTLAVRASCGSHDKDHGQKDHVQEESR